MRHCHRDAPASVEGCTVSQPWAPGHRRGTALRRDAQGEDQGNEKECRCPDADGDADSAYAAYESGRYPRHERAGGSAAGQAAGSDICHGIQRGDHPRSDRKGNGARGAGLSGLQSCIDNIRYGEARAGHGAVGACLLCARAHERGADRGHYV